MPALVEDRCQGINKKNGVMNLKLKENGVKNWTYDIARRQWDEVREPK